MPAHAGRTVWAIVPVKRFAQAKLRLAPLLDEGERRALSAAMLADLLDALAQVAGIDELCIVSDEVELPGEVRVAHRLYDPPQGTLNAAVRHAARHAVQRGAATCCVLHADLPLASGPDIATLLRRHRGGVTLVPDRRGDGTNVLVCTPGDALDFRYGSGSLAAHRAQAQAAGLAVDVVESTALGLDIDRPDDLRQLLSLDDAALAAAGARTRAVLGRLSAAA